MAFPRRILQDVILTLLAGLHVGSPASFTLGGGCYYWLLSSSHVKVSSDKTDLITYFLWVVNPRYASLSEGLQDATSPSKFSGLLSEQFHWLGQEPSVSLAGEENAAQLQAKVTYDNVSRVWNVTFESAALFRFMGQSLLISGRDICLYECAIGNTMGLIKLQPTNYYDQGTVQVKNGMQHVGVIKEPCDKKTMLLLTRTEVFVSQDSLLSTQKLTLPEFGTREVTLKGAVLLLMKFASISQLMILITNLGIVVITSDDFGRQPFTSRIIEKQEFSKMNGVATSSWMCDLHSDDRQLIPIVFWNSNSLLMTNINFTKSTQYSIPTSGVIKDVQFTGHRTTFSVLIFNSASRKISVWKADRSIRNLFKELCSWPADVGSDTYTMTVAPVGITAIYVWNDMAVYYFFGPDNFGKLTIFGSPNDQIGSATDAIGQLVITLKAEVAISLTSGALYYSQVMLKEAWKVRMTVAPDSVLSSDEVGSLLAMQPSNSSNFKRVPLELSYQTIAVENRTLMCPYKDFQISGRDVLNAFRVDLGEEVRVWSLLLLPEGVDDDIIKVEFDKLDVIDAEITNEVVLESRGVSQYKEIRFSVISGMAPRFSRGNTYVGHFGFQLVPLVDDPGIGVCPLPRHMMGYIYVGCSGFKHLRIHRNQPQFRDDDPKCAVFRGKTSAPYRYTLRGDQMRYPNGSLGTKDKTVQYDYAKLGCPITVHYSSELVPMLELVDEVQKTAWPIKVDFVIFEHNSRIFNYNSTALDVKCSVPPQSWKEMAASTNETDMEYMWTPANYKSCHSVDDNDTVEFDEEGVPIIPNDPYQVLNGSNMVGLTFTHSGSRGIYIFTAVVVDPDVSFCHLSTTFAVQVIGKVVRRDLDSLYICLGIYLVLLVVFVVVMYIYFRNHVYGK